MRYYKPRSAALTPLTSAEHTRISAAEPPARGPVQSTLLPPPPATARAQAADRLQSRLQSLRAVGLRDDAIAHADAVRALHALLLCKRLGLSLDDAHAAIADPARFFTQQHADPAKRLEAQRACGVLEQLAQRAVSKLLAPKR